MAIERAYGWHPSRPDFRDLRLATADADIATLPDVDLRTPDPAAGRSFLPSAIYNQGQLGSCTANMAAAAFAFDLAKQGVAYDYLASRLFLYYCERKIFGTVSSDSGATITIAAQVLNKVGAPPESDWPYDISKFTLEPPQLAYQDATQRKAVRYARVDQAADAIVQVLQAGVPVCFGFTVFQSFEGPDTAATGVVPMPQSNESSPGGHAVLIVGRISGQRVIELLAADGRDTSKVDPNSAYYVVRNSWGIEWGHNGYFYMPEAYLLNPSMASDFWVIQSVNSPAPAPVAQGGHHPAHRTHDRADRQLIREMDPWAHGLHLTRRANRAAMAYINWKASR